MEWCKLYARLPDDPAIQQAGEKAAWLFVLGLCYCAREESDGFIPATQLPRFGVRGARRRADTLVELGLWTAVDGGWTVTRWRDLQPTTDRVERRRESDRERQQRRRESRRDSRRDTRDNGSDPDAKHDAKSSRSGRTLDAKRTENEHDEPPTTSENDPSSRRESRSQRRGEESIPPTPPQAGGTESQNETRCTRHRRPRRGCPNCALPPLAPVPPKCDGCGPTRRQVNVETGADLGPCPDCHPSTVRTA